jgi:hypothetical protein
MGVTGDARASGNLAAAKKVAVGDVLDGKYQVERLLGQGGMGVVVAARHLQLEQLVAIKLVLPDAAHDEVVLERFLREARSAAKLRSDHVARVLDVGRLAGGAPYMVMEYLEGADLGEVLDREGPLAVGVACEYVVQACDAVAEAHAQGIVHRDLKPENLFRTTHVGGSGMIKVLDFGISKQMMGEQGSLTQTRTVIGSPLYMAPEQLRSSRRADPRSDVWALGVVLYELLTRRLPFEADSLPDLCLKVSREPPRPIEELRDDLPAELVEVISRCMERDPEKRFADAAALGTALAPFVGNASRQLVPERARSGRELEETRAAPAAPATTVSVRPPRARMRRIATVAVLAVAATWLGALVARRDGPVPSALAALDAARVSSVIAHVGYTEPAPPPATNGAPSAPAVPPAAAAAAPVPRPTLLYRVPRTPSARPARPAPAATDDIPAFR